MGNGKGLLIHHIGHTLFSSSFIPSKTLALKQLLHVPEITKNLLSVSKFAADNHVFFEFHPTSYFVKDLSIQTVLMHDQLKRGLYVFDNTQLKLPLQHPTHHLHSAETLNSSCFAFAALPSKKPIVPVSSTSPFVLWHNRLGHPSSHIVSLVLNKCNLPHLNKIPSLVCFACYMGKIHKSPFLHSSSSYTKPLELIHTDL